MFGRRFDKVSCYTIQSPISWANPYPAQSPPLQDIDSRAGMAAGSLAWDKVGRRGGSFQARSGGCSLEDGEDIGEEIPGNEGEPGEDLDEEIEERVEEVEDGEILEENTQFWRRKGKEEKGIELNIGEELEEESDTETEDESTEYEEMKTLEVPHTVLRRPKTSH